METFAKLAILLNKLYRHYGTRKNNPDASAELKSLFTGVYTAIRVGSQLVSNSKDTKVLSGLLEKEAKKYGALVAAQPKPKGKAKQAPADYEQRGMLMGFEMLNRVVQGIDKLDVNERFVLQDPVMEVPVEALNL